MLTSELAKHTGDTVVMAGWLHRRRQHKAMTFAILRDRSGLTQVLTRDPAVMEQIADLTEFLFVTGYPMVKRTFYTHPDPARPEYSNSFDLLFRGQELVTGGQRLHRYSDYIAALGARSESPDNYASYLAVFAHGMPPHGGFAIGLERWVGRVVGADNIRYVTLFPRDLQRLEP
ncbi:MAG: amino acid--tRNA ligase-related protein [Pseudonocardiaceae bacterium]